MIDGWDSNKAGVARQLVDVAAASRVMRQLFTANQLYHAEVHVLCRLVCEAGP